ncbi:MAG: lipid II flippase MurJ, partial [Pseudomonadota bacterium]
MTLLRNFATVGGATLLSRLLGFARDVLIAGALGAGPIADAFVAAFRLPNLFRRIFAEGAFNAAFVPLFARTLEGDGTREHREEARAFAAEALAGLTLVLLVVSGLAIVFMPALTLALAPGFASDPEKFDLTVLLSRICFPYLFCVSLVALMSGVLNGFRRFAAAAFAPVALNVVLIITLGLVYASGWAGSATAGLALAIGVACAGLVQLALLVIALRRLDFRIPLRRPR